MPKLPLKKETQAVSEDGSEAQLVSWHATDYDDFGFTRDVAQRRRRMLYDDTEGGTQCAHIF